MANESLNNNEKLPGILILFCISTVLGFCIISPLFLP